VYLLNLAGRNRPDALKMLQLLKKFETTPEISANRAVGRAIITCLTTLKQMEV